MLQVLGPNWLTALSHTMHLSPEISELPSPHVCLPEPREKLPSISDHCLTRAQVNAKKDVLPPGQWSPGTVPGEFGEADITGVQPGLYDYKYLLVFVNTVPGWSRPFHP